MASLYQRFGGKINTSRSFPAPPEASHLLGAQCTEETSAAGQTARPFQQESRARFPYQPRSDAEEEDVSPSLVWVLLCLSQCLSRVCPEVAWLPSLCLICAPLPAKGQRWCFINSHVNKPPNHLGSRSAGVSGNEWSGVGRVGMLCNVDGLGAFENRPCMLHPAPSE
uniref:Uncharacterized protein n=1 Tax=Chelonoidis abingdonii TaxID=106734 RepID=A0A8C0J0T2_CHEAB